MNWKEYRTYKSQVTQKGSEPADHAFALLQPPSPGQLAESARRPMKARAAQLQERLSHVVGWWAVGHCCKCHDSILKGNVRQARSHTGRYEIQV